MLAAALGAGLCSLTGQVGLAAESPADGLCDQAFLHPYALHRGAGRDTASGTVTVQGVVVGDFEGPAPALRGFYLQDQRGDGDPATSDAVFVFNEDRDSVRPGQVVRVSGRVDEYRTQTQLVARSLRICGEARVSPIDVRLPLTDARELARYAGMLVRLPQTLYVTELQRLGRFGEVVLSVGSRQAQPTSVVAPGTAALAMQRRNELTRIVIDDTDDAPNPVRIAFGRGGRPLSASNTLRAGDTVSGIVGVLTRAAPGGEGWRLRPVGALGGGAPAFRATNPRPAAPPGVGGSLRVASMNLLNYFNTFGKQSCRAGLDGAALDCRGARDAGEFARQSAKTVAALSGLNADVVALAELENDGYGPPSAIRDLANRLNAATKPGTYAFIDADVGAGRRDALGRDAIRVGLLYKPARVSPVGRTAVLDSPAFLTGGDQAPRNRPALAQAFRQMDGALFGVVANHFKSKGGACDAPDAQDGQGACNGVRVEAARQLRAWLAHDPTGTGVRDMLILGDLNAYAQEDPIREFTTQGWVNLVERFGGPNAYSYAFEGQWGYLDHALASPSLADKVSGAAHWHINADEPVALDYRTLVKRGGQVAALYAADAYRSSDHDPLLVGLSLSGAGRLPARRK